MIARPAPPLAADAPRKHAPTPFPPRWQVYIGPNVVAGYTHPETGKIVKDQAEHAAVMKAIGSVDGGSVPPV